MRLLCHLSQSATSEESLPRETVFEILRNERRRHVLRYLKAYDGESIAFEDLLEYVTARENDVAIEELTATQRKRTYTGLTQIHLPMLGERGVIHYDPETKEVELTPRAREVEFYLEPASESRIPWSYFFLGLSLVSAAALVMVSLGLPPFDSIPVAVILGLSILGFLVSSVIYVRETDRNRLGADLGEE